MMKYKGYTGEAFYDDEIKMFSGLSLSNTFINNFLTLRDTKESQSLLELSDSN